MATGSGFDWDYKMVMAAWTIWGVEVALENRRINIELQEQSRRRIAELDEKLNEILKILKEGNQNG